MSERFFVGTVSGLLSIGNTSGYSKPGLTAIVFDREYNCRNVASYRSEDEGGYRRPRQEMIERALQKAHEHARRLNAQEVNDGLVA